MSMQRRHFEFIARVVSSMYPENGMHHMEADAQQWVGTILRFSRECKVDNPNFKPAQFKKACGLTPEMEADYAEVMNNNLIDQSV